MEGTFEERSATSTIVNTSSVVSQSTNNSGLNVALHPLALMNISDHYTREKVQGNATNRVFGALLGTQKGREIEIYNTYELLCKIIDEKIVVDHSFFVSRQEQFLQVFPDYDFLGWYSVGQTPTEMEMHIHKQMMDFNESPLFLQLNPTQLVVSSSRNLPLALYESTIDIVNGVPQHLFIAASYRIETGEAERISVDHVNQTVNESAGAGSSLIAHLVNQRNAIGMLQSRVKLLHEYLTSVEKGEIQRDHDILRKISSLCNQLPTMDVDEFHEEFMTECNDVVVITYLAAVTKGANAINELAEKFNLAAGSGPGRSRRGFIKEL
ncbi:uncharacterized protein VTP21DRAFT_3673 [Calcarisporiella thermophila]|uniref:uncharacterized protein n=1 Tax=Calcarisporiella thermophila TaxID=911321 RepID=UPI0037443A74